MKCQTRVVFLTQRKWRKHWVTKIKEETWLFSARVPVRADPEPGSSALGHAAVACSPCKARVRWAVEVLEESLWRHAEVLSHQRHGSLFQHSCMPVLCAGAHAKTIWLHWCLSRIFFPFSTLDWKVTTTKINVVLQFERRGVLLSPLRRHKMHCVYMTNQAPVGLRKIMSPH